MPFAYMDVGQSDPLDDRYITCESPDVDWDDVNEREYQKCLKRDLQRPKWCYENCPQAQHCHHGEMFQLEKVYENCSEYWFLEELENDARSLKE